MFVSVHIVDARPRDCASALRRKPRPGAVPGLPTPRRPSPRRRAASRACRSPPQAGRPDRGLGETTTPSTTSPRRPPPRRTARRRLARAPRAAARLRRLAAISRPARARARRSATTSRSPCSPWAGRGWRACAPSSQRRPAEAEVVEAPGLLASTGLAAPAPPRLHLLALAQRRGDAGLRPWPQRRRPPGRGQGRPRQPLPPRIRLHPLPPLRLSGQLGRPRPACFRRGGLRRRQARTQRARIAALFGRLRTQHGGV